MANANFTPDIGPYTQLKPFRFWCQKVLPLVYDDSLSYYELLGKVVDYLNKTMEDVDTQITDIQGLLSAYEALQGWVNHYYDSADFAADIDAGLDRMAESGQLTALLNAIITPQLPDIVDLVLPDTVMTLLPDEVSSQIGGTVQTQLPGVVSNQIGPTVQTQLPGVVSNQIGGTVANQLPAVVSNQIGPVVEDKIVDPVEDWLDANVSGGIAVDRTLSVLGAGADAAFTGARLETLDDTLGYEHVTDTGFIITTANPFAFNYQYINDSDIFSDHGTHTYKMIVVPVNTGDKYCINAHKISVPETENHFAVTYAFCAKYVGDPDTDTPFYLPTIYSRNNAENLIATVPEITIPTGLGYDETTGYLVVITANIEDPVYKLVDEGLRKDVNDLKSDFNQIIGTYKPTVAKEDGFFIDPNGNESPSSNSCASGYIPVIPGQKIYLSALKLTGTRSICAYKENKTFAKRIAGGVSDTECTYTVEDGIYYIRATGNSGTAPVVVYGDLLPAVIGMGNMTVTDYAYVATDGNDTTGDGSATLPFASVDRALQSGATNILIRGGVYNQVVNLNSTSKSAIRLINASMDSLVYFIPSGAKITDSESLETGYTKVYSADTAKTIDTNNRWIYQDGVPDATTAITASERHPAQKGRGYRCTDTKIVKCSATSLSDALTEIEESDQYKWFLNSGKIYFSRPETVNASHPICIGEPYPFFTNVPDNITVELYGISLKYCRLNLEKMKNAKAVDCWVTNIFGSGAFTYNSRGTTLIRCEASCCVNGGNGDGFNGAAGYTGDADAPQTTTMLIDCWSHDNRDDGYSDHNRSDAVLRGGLYEYNVKAGVTPSYGENCACYGVMSRHNERGFLLTGLSTDGSKTSCLICYDCIADNNVGNGNSCGFGIIASGGNMILYNCVALNSPYGFRSETGSNLTLINCGTVDVDTATAGSGTITVKNPSAVS